MTHRQRKYTNESRGPLGAATALDQRVVPVSEITLAKLLRDPNLTIQPSERELDDARKKVQTARDSTRSTS